MSTCPRVVGVTPDGEQLVLCGQALDDDDQCPAHGGPAVVFAGPWLCGLSGRWDSRTDHP